MSRNAVIGFYSGYTSLDTDKGGLRVFVESFRKYNQQDLIIITLVLPIKCLEMDNFCKENNCIIEPVFLEDVKTGNRWKCYKEVLEKKEYMNLNNILIMDMNDAIFTKNPFLIKTDNKLYCAAEKTFYNIEIKGLNMNSMNINTNWMNIVRYNDNPILKETITNMNLKNNSCKNNVESSIYNKPVLCSGSILGNKKCILKLLNWGYNLQGADQGMLNIYAYLINPEGCKILPLAESDILTMDSIDFDKELIKDKNGYILNKYNNRYSICHQIDRGCNLDHFFKIATK